MLGQIVIAPDRRWGVTLEEGELLGLRVMRAQMGWGGLGSEKRAFRAGTLLAKRRVRRVLAPRGFPYWQALYRAGLRAVDPTPMLQALAGELVMKVLELDGKRPERSVVALRGRRADRNAEQTARWLSQRVRGIILSFPQGGADLEAALRREYGLPVRPDGEQVDVAVRLHPDTADSGTRVFNLWGNRLDLCGLTLGIDGVRDNISLELMEALWETGHLPREKITIRNGMNHGSTGDFGPLS